MQSINLGGKLMQFDKPKIMGILNCTPDSFYDGGKYENNFALETQVVKMLDEGVDIIDVGGYSSRPGADDVSEKEEWNRVKPALEMVRKVNPTVPISLDTFRSGIAQLAMEEFGVEMINDIAAGDGDPEMIKLIAEYKPAYCIMHMQGMPQDMQNNPTYQSVSNDIVQYLSSKIDILKRSGVNDVVVDPGFGFGKTIAHNYELLNNLELFNVLETPVLVGISRKSMLYKMLQIKPKDALNATSAANTIALGKGANILRVHDVRQAKECIQVYCKTVLANL